MSLYSSSNSSMASLKDGNAPTSTDPLDTLRSRVRQQSEDLMVDLTDLKETRAALLAALEKIDLAKLEVLEGLAKEDISGKDGDALTRQSGWLDSAQIKVMTARYDLKQIADGISSNTEGGFDIMEGLEFEPL